ncbi:serine/threonine protein kinase [Orrella marina]|uniref:Serine/threonine protein kinase n=2 Tax=Orrella marina TaxID=2163011 RepID=A0A2R4XPY9_9BURK|nr:serine/threonine protein kinase [Orrella marina]
MAIVGIALTVSAVQAQTSPLLQEGKKSLYQRVLTTPDCRLYDQVAGQTTEPVPAFSRFYVYSRREVNGVDWIEVGPDTRGNKAGWLPESCAVDWTMQLTLAFTNPANRDPVLFYENRKTLEDLVDAESPKDAVKPLMDRIKRDGKAPGVVAREPELAVQQQQNFYLLPIFEAQELYTQAGEPLRVLRVASVAKAEQDPATPAAPEQSTLKAFTAAVVFVIDSTISMGPYIDRTRQAVRTITTRIEDSGVGSQVKFGLIAYRASTTAVPGLEYVSKLYVDPATMTTGADFLKRIADLKPATVSSKGFDEDAYAGLETALTQIDWKQFGGRYIVLVTDAGAVPGYDPFSSTKSDAPQIRLAAQERGVAIYVLHLKTPAGQRNHQSAQAQYEELAFNPVVNRPLYYPVQAGSVDSFGQMVDALASSIVQQVELANEGEMAIGSALAASEEPGTDPVKSLARDARLMGHAMQLAYLGEKQGTQAPGVIEAWVTDRDLSSPSRATTQVRVLMTKAQLSDMSDAVRTIVDAANQSHISPSVMFEQLRSVAATMGRDPNQISQAGQTRLAELGLLGEYLEGLPYRSDVLNLDEQTWKSWSAAQQQQFIRNLTSKLALYRDFNADLDRWVALAPDADPGDNVYPVPLEALP